MKPTHNPETKVTTRAAKRKYIDPASSQLNSTTTIWEPEADANVLQELKKVTSELTELKNSVQYMSDKYDELLTELKAEKDENKQLKEDMAQLNANHESLHSRFEAIENDWNNSKQELIRNNVVVFGFSDQASNTQDVRNTVDKLLQKVNIEEVDAITDCYQRRSFNNRAGAIVLKFRNNNTKSVFLRVAKRLEINTSDLGLCNRKTNTIRLTEQLTPMNQQLLNEARQLRSHGFKFIWSRNGRIYGRKTPTAEILVLNNFNYIESLKSTNQTI